MRTLRSRNIKPTVRLPSALVIDTRAGIYSSIHTGRTERTDFEPSNLLQCNFRNQDNNAVLVRYRICEFGNFVISSSFVEVRTVRSVRSVRQWGYERTGDRRKHSSNPQALLRGREWRKHSRLARRASRAASAHPRSESTAGQSAQPAVERLPP